MPKWCERAFRCLGSYGWSEASRPEGATAKEGPLSPETGWGRSDDLSRVTNVALQR